VIVLARIVVRLLADLTGLVVPSATPLTRRQICESLWVRAESAPADLHHEYMTAPATA
jgi:hypothetical protein